MKKTLNLCLSVFLTLAVVFAAATPAFAQDPVEEPVEMQITGTITAIDEIAGTITVETALDEDGDGVMDSYTVLLPEGFYFAKLEVGGSITLTVVVTEVIGEDGTVTFSYTATLVDLPNVIETEGGYYCVNGDMEHPHGAQLAEEFSVDYADLQDWFCAGYGWGQIKHALATSGETGEDPVALLDLRKEGYGWGQIWQEREMKGNPHQVVDDEDDGDEEEVDAKVKDNTKKNNGKAVGKSNNPGKGNKKK